MAPAVLAKVDTRLSMGGHSQLVVWKEVFAKMSISRWHELEVVPSASKYSSWQQRLSR